MQEQILAGLGMGRNRQGLQEVMLEDMINEDFSAGTNSEAERVQWKVDS